MQQGEELGPDSGRSDLISKDFLLETIPGADIVYKIKPDDFEILACSRGLATLTGWDAGDFSEKLKNDQTFKKIHPADEMAFIKTINQIVASKSKGEVIYRGYRKDGSSIWLWFQGRYAGEEDGYPLVEGLILDVSNSTNIYQAILDQSVSIITVVDANTFEVLYANKAAKDIVKNKEGNVVGCVCHKFVYGIDKPCAFCIINHTEGDSYINEELEVKGRFYRQVFKRLLWHGKDAIMEYTTDITNQTVNRNLVKKQKDMQEHILDTIPAGIMVFKFLENDDIEIVSVNRSILEMMGMDKDKALGEASHNITALTHPDDLQIVLDAARKMRTEGAYVEYEYRHFFRSRNDYIWVVGQGRSVRNPDGYVYAYVNYTDITARKEVETLQGKLEKAKIEAETKAEFYSQMSHDMRTPMNGILGVTSLALKEDDVEALHRDLEKIQQSGKYMLNLINDTLDLQRIETKKMNLEPENIESKKVFEDIFTMIQPSIQEKNIDFEFEVVDNKNELDWYIRIDTVRFKQIIINILSNSVKFTPKGGKISLTLEEVGRKGSIVRNRISISDNGIGMTDEFMKNGLFKPFSQEYNSVTEHYPGSGLGLSIVKQLVELMGGTIEVQSEVGKGTTFTIYIDVELIPQTEIDKLNSSSENEQKMSRDVLKGKQILLCEDHPLNAEIVQRLLDSIGCKVIWAENGEIGLANFENSMPGFYDAILMDIRMPVMNGLETARAIRESNREDALTIPIFALSANAYEEDVQKSLEVGMNGHLAKPINTQELIQTLGKQINYNKGI